MGLDFHLCAYILMLKFYSFTNQLCIQLWCRIFLDVKYIKRFPSAVFWQELVAHTVFLPGSLLMRWKMGPVQGFLLFPRTIPTCGRRVYHARSAGAQSCPYPCALLVTFSGTFLFLQELYRNLSAPILSLKSQKKWKTKQNKRRYERASQIQEGQEWKRKKLE